MVGSAAMTNEESKVSLLVGTPAYTGCTAAYIMSLFQTLVEMPGAGVFAQPYILPGFSIISQARNEIGRTFQLSGMDYLLMIDADIAFQPATALRMVERARKTNAEFLVALPPLRQIRLDTVAKAVTDGKLNPTKKGRIFSGRLLGELEGEGRLEIDAEGFGKIEASGLAFALLHKSVFERLGAAHPELRYRAPDQTLGWGLFNPIIRDEHSYGEDMSFCRRWRDLGGDIWLLADAPMSHEGPMIIEGNFAENAEAVS